MVPLIRDFFSFISLGTPWWFVYPGLDCDSRSLGFKATPGGVSLITEYRQSTRYLKSSPGRVSPRPHKDLGRTPIKGSRLYMLTGSVWIVDRLKSVIRELNTSLPIIPPFSVHRRWSRRKWILLPFSFRLGVKISPTSLITVVVPTLSTSLLLRVV